MLNSQFKLLTESLGFYSAKQITLFLKNEYADFKNLTERPVEYWLKGKKNETYIIPNNVVHIFLRLKEYQEHIISMVINGEIKYNFIYKISENMWTNHPELKGLPTTFLNQIVIKLEVFNDYYENSSIIKFCYDKI